MTASAPLTEKTSQMTHGNVVNFTSTATQIFLRSYTYDELNRLSTMSSPADASGCYGLSWTYDAWGNRLSQNVTSGACGSPSYTLATNNRIIDPGFTHDSAGNMIHDASHAYTYNGESELTQVDSGSTATYVYGASGKRVRKIANGITTDYVYALGSVAAEIQGSAWTKGYVSVGGNLLVQYNGLLSASGSTTVFSHADYLGSTRVLTTVASIISDSMDYLPFGELLTGGSGTTHKFAGKERDPESGLDNFGARYDSSNIGRFVSPDPVMMMSQRLADPQQWNMYAYVRNNPLSLSDPTGMYTVNCKEGDKKCAKAADNFEKHRQKDLKSKHEDVRNAAEKWGDRKTNGEDDGIHVTFKSQAEVNKDGNNTNPEKYDIGSIVRPVATADHKPLIEAEFSESVDGSDLDQLIAHEGSHVGEDMTFLNSYNSSTNKYDGSLNPSSLDSEVKAYLVGAQVKPYDFFTPGPNAADQTTQFLLKDPNYARTIRNRVFSTKDFPQ